ncbi:MAG: hypothetical protein ACI822_002104 [Gammaproteobacteria bacterium]|jgi:hypothetical protein
MLFFIWDSSDTDPFEIQPLSYARGLAAAAQNAGTDILSNQADSTP